MNKPVSNMNMFRALFYIAILMEWVEYHFTALVRKL